MENVQFSPLIDLGLNYQWPQCVGSRDSIRRQRSSACGQKAAITGPSLWRPFCCVCQGLLWLLAALNSVEFCVFLTTALGVRADYPDDQLVRVANGQRTYSHTPLSAREYVELSCTGEKGVKFQQLCARAHITI
jgi:hypothetical protein